MRSCIVIQWFALLIQMINSSNRMVIYAQIKVTEVVNIRDVRKNIMKS